ncbi:DUF3772 domain-containing protein [Pseudooceanicola sp. LIPI14-2-Ac024]|uniref:DUF3772 domain-containing protein n=1 Tax=Pseudooceanicola sp. LIPI14-2-Ac024 TaxID=3344875 RepID=UPI0035CF4215
MLRHLRLLALVLLGLTVVATAATVPAPVLAQTVPGIPDTPEEVDIPTAEIPTSTSEIDYDAWNTYADEARRFIVSGDATDRELEALRADLVKWRDLFSRAQSINAEAIATTQAQLDALGPGPAEGEAEAPEIAQERESLSRQLSELRAPVLAAEVAWNTADALIRAIDRSLRERQTERLLQRGPAPLNPLNWPGAVSEVVTGVKTLSQEVTDAWNDPENRAAAMDRLPVTLILFIIGFVMIFLGRRWVERMTQRVMGKEHRSQRYLAGVLLSLGQVALPVIGSVLLITAVLTSGLIGEGLGKLALELPQAIVAFAVARWVGVSVFPATEMPDPILSLEPQRRLEGRVYATSLGLILAFYLLLDAFGKSVGWSLSALNVVLYPLVVLEGLMLFRVAQLIQIHSQNIADDDEEHSFRRRVVGLFARGVKLVAVFGPLVAGIGYFNLGYATVFPTVQSLQLVGVLMILHTVIIEIYILATRNTERARNSLIPVMVAALLVIFALPLFALIWGARVTDLTEWWVRFSGGISFGEITISPSLFIRAILVFVIGLTLVRVIQGALRTTVLPKTKMDAGAQSAVIAGLGYVGIFLISLMAIMAAGIDLSALGYVAGALSVGIGFGLQNIVSNFVSGIILLIERPVSEGDWIEVGPNMGTVRSISVRSTRIETFDRQEVIVPNADLVQGTVTNWTRGNLVGRLIVPVGVAYGSNTRHVAELLREIAEAQPIVLLNPAPFVLFKGFGASSLDFEVRCILRDVNQMNNVLTEMNHQIAERFGAEGIEIPFPQQDLWLRNPETLTGRARTEPVTPAELAQAEQPRPAPTDQEALGWDVDAGDGGGDGDGR